MCTHDIEKKKRSSETINKELSDFTAQSFNSQPTICDHFTADQKIIKRSLGYFTALFVEGIIFTSFFNENNQVYMR